ncbi:MAG: hypothetical protein ACNFW9_05670 [Candidatus Kerfeldbacteria bacterium]|jgi:hypothetical protein
MKKKLLVSITGRHKKDWVKKLAEIEKYNISEIALYIEIFSPKDRIGLLEALQKSCVKKISMTHIKDDTTKEELNILYKKFGTRYFTIHEDHFNKKIISHWKGYYKNLYLEMTTDNYVSPKVKVENIGGFCIDLAHFKKQVTLQDKEYAYIFEHINKSKSGCNHLSGYSNKNNIDLHVVKNAQDFKYIKTLPHNLFGNVISFEIFNSIKDQLRFLPTVKKILEKDLNFKIINN